MSEQRLESCCRILFVLKHFPTSLFLFCCALYSFFPSQVCLCLRRQTRGEKTRGGEKQVTADIQSGNKEATRCVSGNSEQEEKRVQTKEQQRAKHSATHVFTHSPATRTTCSNMSCVFSHFPWFSEQKQLGAGAVLLGSARFCWARPGSVRGFSISLSRLS